MGFQSVFLFCTKKIIWSIWRKKKFRSYTETKLQFLHGLYGGNLSKMFCAILTKIKEASIFVSIPHCPIDYCIPAYSTVFCFVFLLNKALLVFVWNNLDSNSMEH